MKSKLSGALALMLCLLLYGCAGAGTAAEQPAAEPYTPTPTPLPVSNGIDWNDIPRIWVGRGGPTTDYYDGYTYRLIDDNWPAEYTYDSYEADGVSYYTGSAKLTGLHNTSLQSKLNLLIARTEGALIGDPAYFEANVTDELRERFPDDLSCYSSVNPSITFVGNLVNIQISRSEEIYGYRYGGEDDYDYFNKVRETCSYFTYDMMTGQQLQLSDLFADNVDLDALLNPMITASLESSDEFEMTRPFRGLPADYPFFMLHESSLDIYFPNGNPYCSGAAYVSLDIEDLEPYLAQPISTSEPFMSRDSGTTFADYYRFDNKLKMDLKNDELCSAFGDDSFSFTPYLLRETAGRPGVGRINEQVQALYDEIAAAPLPESFEEIMSHDDAWGYASADISSDKGFAVFSFYASCGYNDTSDNYINRSVSIHRMFSAVTGELYSLADVVTDPDAIRQHLKSCGYDIDPAQFYNFATYSPDNLSMYPDDEYNIDVPGTMYLDPDFMKQ